MKRSKIVEIPDGDQVDLEQLIGSVIAAHPKGKQLDEHGREVGSPVPIAPPVGYVKSPDIFERVRDLVRSEHVRYAAQAGGLETFEEADDFEIGDDYDPRSPYEQFFDPPPSGARGGRSRPHAEGRGGDGRHGAGLFFFARGGW